MSTRKGWFADKQSARVLLEIKGRSSPQLRLKAANRIASAIGALFTYVHHTWYDEIVAYKIPERLITGPAVSIDELEKLESRLGRSSFPNSILNRLTSCVIIAEPLTATIFYLLPFVLGSEELFNACTFFQSCCSAFSFMDGVVNDVLYEPKREPENEIERLALENVVLQSFRTVEAIIGEPGNNSSRFHQRLRDWNLRPSERVGFPGHRKHRLEDRIRWLQDVRDSTAAHGKRRRSDPFTTFEAMEAQHLAHSVLDRALWTRAESVGRDGTESEVSFLLEEMFPYNPGWSRDQKLFNGRRAVDLARTPGGLTKVLRLANRGF